MKTLELKFPLTQSCEAQLRLRGERLSAEDIEAVVNHLQSVKGCFPTERELIRNYKEAITVR